MSEIRNGYTGETICSDECFVEEFNDNNKVEEVYYKKLPWYLKDEYGYPIEFQKGKPRLVRIIFQNIRKLLHI